MKKIKLAAVCGTLGFVLGMPVLLTGCDSLYGGSSYNRPEASYGTIMTKHTDGSKHEDHEVKKVKHSKSSSSASSVSQPAAQPVTTSTVPLEAPAVGQ